MVSIQWYLSPILFVVYIKLIHPFLASYLKPVLDTVISWRRGATQGHSIRPKSESRRLQQPITSTGAKSRDTMIKKLRDDIERLPDMYKEDMMRLVLNYDDIVDDDGEPEIDFEDLSISKLEELRKYVDGFLRSRDGKNKADLIKQLTLGINMLPSEEVHNVVRFIQLKLGGEINFETLSVPTLKELMKYVNHCLKQTR